MQILTDVQAPPSAQPTAPGSPSPTAVVSVSPSVLPTTGRGDVAVGALSIGLPAVLLGILALVALRRRRTRMG